MTPEKSFGGLIQFAANPFELKKTKFEVEELQNALKSKAYESPEEKIELEKAIGQAKARLFLIEEYKENAHILESPEYRESVNKERKEDFRDFKKLLDSLKDNSKNIPKSEKLKWISGAFSDSECLCFVTPETISKLPDEVIDEIIKGMYDAVSVKCDGDFSRFL